MNPGMRESVIYYQNISDTYTKRGIVKIFYIKITKKPSEKRDPTNPFEVHLVNPLLKFHQTNEFRHNGNMLGGVLDWNFPPMISRVVDANNNSSVSNNCIIVISVIQACR